MVLGGDSAGRYPYAEATATGVSSGGNQWVPTRCHGAEGKPC